MQNCCSDWQTERQRREESGEGNRTRTEPEDNGGIEEAGSSGRYVGSRLLEGAGSRAASSSRPTPSCTYGGGGWVAVCVERRAPAEDTGEADGGRGALGGGHASVEMKERERDSRRVAS